MKVDHVLILAAGAGTRMGEIGKTLPKVLWPVYEKPLLELQILYAKELAPDAKIYINTYHYTKELKAFINETTKDVELLVETDRLDIGGAIHNLASKLSYKGNILILNGDQFFYFDQKVISESLRKLRTHDSVLFSYKVNALDGYNGLALKDGKLAGIIPNKNFSKNEDLVTYTGLSLIKLESLKKITGESKFFDSVANCKTQSIWVENLDEIEYWDFGTLKRYYSSMYKILLDLDHPFCKFLVKNNAIKLSKVKNAAYNASNGINLSSDYLELKGDNIILNEVTLELKGRKKEVLFKNLSSPVE